ncbi:hypothetical protein KMZ93_15705 [Bradyrhizobium sediminis]|uniref:Uncharacterized protein n=1 Tax=Bradyrhizobium sediminis TaxID=2840469 RepID=A0A975NU74_9BRAD|nr:hypothetical protein [Bradyrhizobium sediminis]QWG21458.1 hypothetical protein KMZ93_15705 [Bradyrhizobium sediminis]
MSQEAAIEGYTALVQWLRENKLEWLAEQIEEEAALGKTEPERIAISEIDAPRTAIAARSTSPVMKQQSAEFLVRVDYSPYEKFNIALDAIRAVVIGAVKIQDALANALPIDGGEIRFVPGETGDTEHQYRLSDLTTQRAAIDEVEPLLKQLTEDVHK